MDKGALIVSIVELVIFLLPTIKIFISLGEYKNRIKTLEEALRSMNNVNDRLTKLETKLDFIIEQIKTK